MRAFVRAIHRRMKLANLPPSGVVFAFGVSRHMVPPVKSSSAGNLFAKDFCRGGARG